MASFGNAAWLDKGKINGNYSYRTDKWGAVGGAIAYVSLWGSRNWGTFDPTGDPYGLYGPGAGTGSRTGKPNSAYWIFELDYVPWWQKFVTKFTLQYTVYSHVNGARSRYDGSPAETFPYAPRRASYNNNLYLLIWQVF